MLVAGKFWKIWFCGGALLDVGFLFFCLDLIFMFLVMIWGFFVCFSCRFSCVCLPRKFTDLKGKICFVGDMGLAFGWDLGLGFGSLLEIDYWEEHRGRTRKNKITKAIKIKQNKRQKIRLIYLFCFDVFGYKESTRKTKKIIRK